MQLPAPVDRAVMPLMTEAEMARSMKRMKCHIKRCHGRYWFAHPGGFYHAIHWMGRFHYDEAVRPSFFCWGFRATLDQDEAEQANATLPVHLLRGLESFTMSSLSSKRRNKVRNCMKQVEIVKVLSPEFLAREGYDAYVSSWRRTGYGKLMSLHGFGRKMAFYLNEGRGLVLAGLVNDKVAGIIAAFAIDRTAYIDQVYLATEHLSTNLGTGLVYQLTQACRRSGRISELVYGLHAREKRSLCRYKEEMCFPVVHVPARVWFLPTAESLVRTMRPHSHYRLTGHD